MQTTIKHLHYKWLRKRKLRRWQRLLKKHQAIAKEGFNLSAKAVKIYEEKAYKRIKLIRVQLSLDFLNDGKHFIVSKCLLKKSPSLVLGRTIHFKFLPGDFSQIVIVH